MRFSLVCLLVYLANAQVVSETASPSASASASSSAVASFSSASSYSAQPSYSAFVSYSMLPSNSPSASASASASAIASFTTSTPTSTVNASVNATANANATVPHYHTEATLPQNTIIGIAVGVSAGLLAFVWAIARYIYNKRYLDTKQAKTLNIRVPNKVNSPKI